MLSEKENWFFVAGKGFLLTLIIFALALFVLGTFYSIADWLDGEVAVSTLLFFNYLAIFVGGFWAGKSSETKGWQKGLLIGFLYALIMFIWARASIEQSLQLGSLSRLVLMSLTGMVGGILGVNIKKK